MATVRKRERRLTLMSTKVKSVKREGQDECRGREGQTKVKGVKREGQAMPQCRSFNALSPIATSSARGQSLYLHNVTFTPLYTFSYIYKPRLVAIGGFNQRQGKALPLQIFLTLKFVVCIALKIIEIVATGCQILRLKRHQIRFQLGLLARPR